MRFIGLNRTKNVIKSCFQFLDAGNLVLLAIIIEKIRQKNCISKNLLNKNFLFSFFSKSICEFYFSQFVDLSIFVLFFGGVD